MTTSPDILGPAEPGAPPARRRPTARLATHTRARRQVDWPLVFLVGYIGCQLGLLFLGSTPLRVPMRVGAFSISLALAVVIWPGRDPHPATKVLPVLLLCLIPGLFMTGQPSVIAAIAEATLYAATLAPLLWVSHRPMGLKPFRRVLLVLWGFNVLSSATGVLQVYYPGLFQSQLSAVLLERGRAFIGSLTIELANGTRTFRPMGLTDYPGGAANAGLYAILFGMGLVFTERRWPLRVIALLGMVVGLFVIYLSHVRVTLVMAAIGVIVIAATFVRRGDVRRASTLLALALLVTVVGTVWAFTVGGDETARRWATLAGSENGDAFSESRGWFIEDAFTKELFDFPLGAGMGRWGMISYYFGSPTVEPLWAEIMWTAWLYDGGIPLMVLFCVIIGITLLVSWQVGTARGGGNLAVWGGIMLAYNVAVVAATFDAPVFATQTGMELWFLNACLYNAWRTAGRTSAAAAIAGAGRPAETAGSDPGDAAPASGGRAGPPAAVAVAANN